MKDDFSFSMEDAEASIEKNESDKEIKKSNSNLLRVVGILSLLAVFSVVIIRFFIINSTKGEPTYEIPVADSAFIFNNIEMLEMHVREYGYFPGDIQDFINSSDDASLIVNDDGSFTYTESGIVYRSDMGLLGPSGGNGSDL